MVTSALVLAVLATVLLHSALLCSAALLVGRFILQAGRRSQLHRCAAVGALATTVVAMTLGGGASIATPRADVLEPVRRASVARGAEGAIASTPQRSGSAESSAGTERGRADAGLTSPLGSPAPWVLGVWGVVAALWIGRDLARRRRFVAQLEREPLGELTPGGAALSASDALESPVALSGGEVCVPRALWRDASASERAAILAHEDAHIARHDPAWRLALRTVRAVLWFQPLLGLVIAREAEAAELDCDERALDRGAEPLVLAQVLARVAEGGLRAAPPFPAMARRPALVVERVARLTSPRPALRTRGSGLFGAGIACALALFACTAPTVDAPEQDRGSAPVADDALVVQIDRSGRARLFGPGDEVARVEVNLSDRAQQSALGDAMAALAAEPSFPKRSGRAEPYYPGGFFVPSLRANPVHVRLEPDTRFAYAQHVMTQAARADTAFWNIIVEDASRSYALPLPVEGGAGTGGMFGVDIRIAPDGGAHDGRYGVSAARSLLGVEEEVEEDESSERPATPARNWVNLAGLEEVLRSETRAGHKGVSVAPSPGATLADVAPVLDAIESTGAFNVLVQGSFD